MSRGVRWNSVLDTDADEPLHKAPGSSTHGGADTRFVLVVDDNPINREVAICMLESLGYQTESATNGLEALKACSARRHAAILMDLQMPELDGYQAASLLRGAEGDSPPTPILAMTAHAVESDRQRALDVGMNDYVTKPIDIDGLAQLLTRWAPFNTTHNAQAPLRDALAVNESLLEDLRALQQKDRPSVVLSVLRSCIAQLTDIEQRIDDAWAKEGLQAVGRLAHWLKASVGTVGAEALARMCGELEDACRADDEAASHRCYAALRQERARVVPMVATMLVREERGEPARPGAGAQSAQRFMANLLEEVHAHRAVGHRFLVRFGQEQLTLSQLASFASQYHLYARDCERNLAAVIANIPDENARNALVVNLYEDIGAPLKMRDTVHVLLLSAGMITTAQLREALASKGRGRDIVGALIAMGAVTQEQVGALVAAASVRRQDLTHAALWRRFLRAIGLDADALSHVEALASTVALIETYRHLCRDGHFLTATGAMGPGTERVVASLYTPIVRGIEHSAAVKTEDCVCWPIHIAAAEGHGLVLCDAMLPYVATVQGQRLVAEGARCALDARACWFDGLLRLVFGGDDA